MNRFTGILCLTVAVLFGCVGKGCGTDTPFWQLKDALIFKPDKTRDVYIRRGNIEISLQGKGGTFYAKGIVDINVGECQGYISATGELKVFKENNKNWVPLKIWNFPLGKQSEICSIEKTSSQNKTGRECILDSKKIPLNKKMSFKVDDVAPSFEKKPIQWIDIDNDGVEELLVVSVCGNRFANHYNIYEYEKSGKKFSFTNRIETRTDPRPMSRTIQTDWSSSSCPSSGQKFLSIAGKYQMIEETDVDDACRVRTFKRSNDGKMCLSKMTKRDKKKRCHIAKTHFFFPRDHR